MSTPSFFISRVAVRSCSVEKKFWNFPENPLENTRDAALPLF